MDDVLKLGERPLGLDDVVSVARLRRRVVLHDSARARMERSRIVVERLLEERVKVYGLTTGFGSKKNVFIDPAETRTLQRNLIRSHSCGLGSPLSEEVVRATILLRAGTLARGMSGARVCVVESLLSLLNLDIYPYIPEMGSLGASGDLAPLSHLALVLMGDPAGLIAGPDYTAALAPREDACPRRDFIASTPDVLNTRGFSPLTLEAKEGLALNNGTQVMTAVGLLVLEDARSLVTVSEGACAMSFEALKGVPRAFDKRLHDARPHPGQSRSAWILRAFTAESQILAVPLNMASINAASRELRDVTFYLQNEDSPLAEDISTRVSAAQGALELLRAHPEHPMKGLRENATAHEALDAYRRVLEPIKTQLLGVYRSLISSSFVGDGRMAQTSMARALGCLEEAVPVMPRVQDNYSLRCAPQVIGAVRHAIDHAMDVLLTEANSTTDNPLIFPPETLLDGTPLPLDDLQAYRHALDIETCHDAVCSGGNFHGEPVALVMDYVAIALSELGNISERRTAHLVDGHLNQGLPSLLIYEAGLNSGFMIPQYTAAALVSENKSLAHPASVDSIPSCENSEDHVSMGTIAARKARRIARCVEDIVAIEVFTAFQAIHFRAPLRAGRASRCLMGLLAEMGVEFVEEDRPLFGDIEKIAGEIRSGRIAHALSGLLDEVRG